MSTTDPYAPRERPRSQPMRALIRWWPVTALCVILGVAAGFLVARQVPVTYTAEARVAVGYGDLAAGAVAGFPTASESLASNYARYVNDQALQGDSGVTVAASQIPDSNVIRVVGSGPDRAATRTEVDRATADLVDRVNNPQGRESADKLLKDFDKAAATWAEALSEQQQAQGALTAAQSGNGPAGVDIAELRQELADATSKTASAELRKNAIGTQYQTVRDTTKAADLTVVREASPTGNDLRATTQRYCAIGLIAGLLLALVACQVIERRRSPAARRASMSKAAHSVPKAS